MTFDDADVKLQNKEKPWQLKILRDRIEDGRANQYIPLASIDWALKEINKLQENFKIMREIAIIKNLKTWTLGETAIHSRIVEDEIDKEFEKRKSDE